MTNDEIKNHVFNDPIVDNIKKYNLYLRSEYIDGKISRTDYITGENILALFYNQVSTLSEPAQFLVCEIIGDGLG